MLNTISPVPKKKIEFLSAIISTTKWLPIFKFDNSGTKRAIKMHIMSNSTIFAMTNSLKLLFFKFTTI